MRKLIVFMHVSLDGFVAGPAGQMDWIKVDEEVFDYAGKQTDLADAALYGRVTYEMMDGYWPTAGDEPDASRHDKQHSGWYNSVEKIVLSTTLESNDAKNRRVISGNAGAEIRTIKNQNGNNILVFGSPTAVHTLIAENLIDEYWLFVNPVLLGEGIPLFKNIGQKTTLELVETSSFKGGVVCLHYRQNNTHNLA